MNADLETKQKVFEAENVATFNEKAAAEDYKAGAIEAENAEHSMTVLQAVRAYPMASFWAFVMSCCIVRGPLFPGKSDYRRPRYKNRGMSV